MTTQKKLGHRAVILMLLIAIFGIALYLSVGAGVYAESAEDVFTIESVMDECIALTESDVLEGATPLENGELPTVDDYVKNVQSGKYDNDMILQQDHLYRIIPMELFRHVGQWFYYGYEYSFYVGTWHPLNNDKEYQSDVAIIDNTYFYEPITNQIRVTVSIDSFHYRSYVSIDKTFCTDLNGVVAREFFLTDVLFFTQIENEHELNYIDIEEDLPYSKFSDVGTVITQARLNYAGLYNNYDVDTVSPLIDEGLDLTLSMIPNVNNTKLGVDIVIYAFKLLAEGCDGVEKYKVDIINNNEINIETFPSRESQLNSDNDSFIRSVYASPVSGLMVNDYAQMITLLNGGEPTRVSAGVFYRFYIHDTAEDSVSAYSQEDGRWIIKTVKEDFYDSETAVDNYTPMCYSRTEVLFDEQKYYNAALGENTGYLLADDSVQKFEFTPEKNGCYTISCSNNYELGILNEHNTVLFSNNVVNDFDSNTKYIIEVRKKRGNEASNYFCFNVEFTPEDITLSGRNIRTVKSMQKEYYRFTPTTSGIYSLKLNEAYSDVFIGIYNAQDNKADKTIVGSRESEMYLYAGECYYIELYNSGMDDKTLDIRFEKGRTISVGDAISDKLNLTRIYTFIPEYNGVFTFSFNSSYIVNFALYNEFYEEVYNLQSASAKEYSCFLHEGKQYYFAIDANLENTDFTGSITFTPPEINGKFVTLNNLTEYNVAKFVPQLSGVYDLSLNVDSAADIEIYTSTGDMAEDNYFYADQTYFIVVSSVKSSGSLFVDLKCENIVNGQAYQVKSGKNNLIFTAPLSGHYYFEGFEYFILADSNYMPLHKGGCASVELVQGRQYYINFSSDQASNAVFVKFDPVSLNLYGNIVTNEHKYYKITVSDFSAIAFKATSWTDEDVTISVYYDDLTLLDSAYNVLTCNLQAGEYYVEIDPHGSDALISVNNYSSETSPDAIDYVLGIKASVAIQENGGVIFKYENTRKICGEYYLDTDIVLGENISVNLYGIDNSGNIACIDLHQRRGEEGKFSCYISPAYSAYYFQVQSEKYKLFEFDLYMPANIEDIYIINQMTGQSVKVGETSSLYLAIGYSYSIDVICNDNATYGVEILSDNTNEYIGVYGSTVELLNNAALADTQIEIKIKTVDGNDFTTLRFTIKLPYKALWTISNNMLTLEFKDPYGNDVSDESNVYSAISYSYVMNGNTYPLSGNTPSVSLLEIPNVDSVIINVYVSYQAGYTESFECRFYETVYSMASAFSTAGKKRLLIDATLSSDTLSKTINVPTNIEVLNIKGNSGITYSSVKINIAARPSPLTINMHDFNFTCTSSNAIYSGGTGRIHLNIIGSSTIKTTCLETDAIAVKNLGISGGNLYVYGGDAYAYRTHKTAGAAISADWLYISNCNMLYARGGNGILGNSFMQGDFGAHGGIGIKAVQFDVHYSNVQCYGGNGGYGLRGADGNDGNNGANGVSSNYYAGAVGKPGVNGGRGGDGGNGGHGGLALFIGDGTYYIVSSQSYYVKLIGGDGGNGGDGGDGGSGGDGGNGYQTQGRKDSNNAGIGGNGGNGGDGGNGGAFGIGGLACNRKITEAETTNGVNGIGGFGGSGGDGGNGGRGGPDTRWSGAEGSGGNGGIGYFMDGGTGGRYGYGGLKGDDGGNADSNVHNGSAGKNGNDGAIGPQSMLVTISYGNWIYIKLWSSKDVTLRIYTNDNTGDPYLELYDANGVLVAKNDDYNGSRNSQITYTIQGNIMYSLVARLYSSQADGSYMLHVEQV